MKIERFKISHGSVVELECCCVLSFTNNVLTLKVEKEEVVLYINTDTGSKIKSAFNIIEVKSNEKLEHLNMTNFIGTTEVNGVTCHYFVVTNEEYLMYFNK